MLNIALEIEQEQRKQSDGAAIEKETDYFSVGKFDGLIGCQPTQVENHGYWSGYQIGLRKYWASKKGIELETEF